MKVRIQEEEGSLDQIWPPKVTDRGRKPVVVGNKLSEVGETGNTATVG